MAMMALLFLSCVNTEDPTQGATVRLKLTGGIAVNQPADDATRAVSDSESLTVNSMRVLIFNNGALVSNKLFTSGYYTIDGTGNNWIVSMNDNAAYVEARDFDHLISVQNALGRSSSRAGIMTSNNKAK